MPRFSLFLLLLLPLAACDSGGEIDPVPTDATVAVTIEAIQADSQCDERDGNPGDFQFKIDLVDEGNNLLQSLVLPGTATYGINSGTVELLEGQRLTVGEVLTVQRPRVDGSGFGVVFSGIEWDSATSRDVRFNDISKASSFGYLNGAFLNVAGNKTLKLGPISCDVTLEYSISAG